MNQTDVPVLPDRAPDSHKGDFGHVLVVGGSAGMAGAAALAGMAAQRSGAGLVTVACPKDVQPIVAAMEPSYMTFGWPSNGTDALREVLDFAAKCNCVAIGPGMGRSPEVRDLVLALAAELPVPVIMDADALVAMADAPSGVPLRRAATIMTPHPGEFRRLLRDEQLDTRACRERAPQWAKDHGVTLVLKGNATLITDGVRSHTNSTGNPGMATGGTGDILTGVIAGLVAQSMPPWDAAVLGAYIHGLAGDLAAEQLGEVSLIASDLLRFLPSAFLQWSRANRPQTSRRSP